MPAEPEATGIVVEAAGADPGRLRPGLLTIVALVLLAHAGLLGGARIVWPGAASEPVRARPLQARQVVPEPPVPVAADPTPAPLALASLASLASPAAPAPILAHPRPKALPRRSAPALPRTEPPAAAPPPAAPEPEAPAARAPAAPDGDLPLYRAAPLPPATLRYAVRLGRGSGTGTLRWEPDGDRYSARFDVDGDTGLALLAQTSRGRLGPHGLEPARFTDRRPRRGELAVNFDAEQGRVSFSGPATVLDHHPGLQDRLSWLLQLGAIVAAEPARLRAGETVSLHLIGLRGDAGVSVLRSAGAQTLDTPAGPVETVRFAGDPRGVFDAPLQVWLAAAPPHVPVRAVLGNGSDAGAVEWTLLDPLAR